MPLVVSISVCDMVKPPPLPQLHLPCINDTIELLALRTPPHSQLGSNSWPHRLIDLLPPVCCFDGTTLLGNSGRLGGKLTACWRVVSSNADTPTSRCNRALLEHDLQMNAAAAAAARMRALRRQQQAQVLRPCADSDDAVCFRSGRCFPTTESDH